jgi:aspartate kinase
MRSVDLSEVGNDIVLEPATDVKRIVMKFGGSSLATAERLTYVARLVQKHVEAGYKPVIVCSALGKTTNALLAAGDFALGGEISNDSIRTLHMATIKQLGLASNLHLKEDIDTLMREMEQLLQGVKYIGELSPRTLDALVSFGERMSVRIVAALLNKMGVPAQSFDSWALGLTTSSEFQDADVLDESYGKLKESLSKFEGFMVPIITGFIAHDKNGKITTLGRGGSDLTATVIGAAAEMDEIQVWKDVDGILTADPRVVTNAHPVEKVTYEEAAELAYFGAQVLHPISMQPAIRFKVPVRVKNSYNPSAVGTAIVAERDKMRTLVTALTSKNNVQLIDIVSTKMLGQYGFLAKVFNLFESYKVYSI